MPRTTIQPLALDQMTPEQRKHLEPVTDRKGRVLNVFGTLIRNFPLFRAWTPFGRYTMAESTLAPLSREIVILRVAANIECEYEWHHHARIARSAGMTEEVLAHLRSGEPLDDEDSKLLVASVDELTSGFMVSESTWNHMIDRDGFEFATDVIYTAGAYMVMSMALKSIGVRLESDESEPI